MSNLKGGIRGTSKDENLKTRLLKPKGHRWTEKEVNTPVGKRDTGVKRLSRFCSIIKSRTGREKNDTPTLPTEG